MLLCSQRISKLKERRGLSLAGGLWPLSFTHSHTLAAERAGGGVEVPGKHHVPQSRAEPRERFCPVPDAARSDTGAAGWGSGEPGTGG